MKLLDTLFATLVSVARPVVAEVSFVDDGGLFVWRSSTPVAVAMASVAVAMTLVAVAMTLDVRESVARTALVNELPACVGSVVDSTVDGNWTDSVAVVWAHVLVRLGVWARVVHLQHVMEVTHQ